MKPYVICAVLILAALAVVERVEANHLARCKALGYLTGGWSRDVGYVCAGGRGPGSFESNTLHDAEVASGKR